MGTKAIMTALLVDTDEQKQSLYDGFKELGFHPPKDTSCIQDVTRTRWRRWKV